MPSQKKSKNKKCTFTIHVDYYHHSRLSLPFQIQKHNKSLGFLFEFLEEICITFLFKNLFVFILFVRLREIILPSVSSVTKCLQHSSLAEARNQRLRLGLPHRGKTQGLGLLSPASQAACSWKLQL